ncbi:oxidoreductase [Bordetella genomosp. 8]|uniref:Oxidoreductase n=1 Tax=Bordetella genomosp. 8 TaxID=1416806 RepID=A0A1W6YL23_9BORD|nr:SDR family oxidoreductase [Bordetella genomosp. 8]ARP81786.1 oxidoreductase [Bordetella genomosp. 8]
MVISGRRTLITGGTSGIGLATARALGLAGARVFISGRREANLSDALASLRAEGIRAEGIAADVTSDEQRAAMLAAAVDSMQGLDILVNNAGGVRAGRLELTEEKDIRAMVEVNLIAPILLTRAALPLLRASGDGLVVNVASGIALVGMPFYTTYAGVKAGISHFGEALRRELKGEGVHVLTVYPGATETPMMSSSRAGPAQGFVRESAADVAQAIVGGIEEGAYQVIRGGEARAQMIRMNREDPAALDEKFQGMKSVLDDAVKDHSTF